MSFSHMEMSPDLNPNENLSAEEDLMTLRRPCKTPKMNSTMDVNNVLVLTVPRLIIKTTAHETFFLIFF